MLQRGIFWKTWFTWIALCIALLVTVVASLQVKQGIEQAVAKQFAFASDQITRKIKQRLDDYSLILRGSDALFEASKSVDRNEWRAYVEALQAKQIISGAQGIGFAQVIPATELGTHIATIRAEGFPDYAIRPPGERAIYTSIVYLEPFRDSNLLAFGYDMYSEPVRRAAMEQARDTGKAALSGKVELVQETGAEIQAGALMYVPVYRNGAPRDTLEQRRAALIGWVYTPYRMNDFMAGVLRDWETHEGEIVHLNIYDGPQAIPAALLFDSKSANLPKLHALLTQQRTINFNDHQWLLAFEQTGKSSGINYAPAWATLAGGVTLSGLLFSLMLSVTNTRARAVRIAEGLAKEITHSHELLKESEFRWKFAIEGSGDGLLDWNIANNTVFFSKIWKEMLGFGEDEIGNGLEELTKRINPEDMANAQAKLQDYLDGKISVYINEYRVRCKDDSYKWILDRGMIVSRGEDGKPLRMIGTHRDITQSKQAEATLTESRDLLQTIIDTAPIRVFWKDRNLRYLGCNLAFAKDAGMTHPLEVIGKDDYQMGWSTQAEIYRTDDSIIMESGIAKLFYDEPQSTPSGQVIWLRTSKVPLTNQDNEVFGLLGIYEDITERKLLEDEREEALSRLQKIANRVPGVVYESRLRPDGSFCMPFASEAIRKMFHVSPEEIREDGSKILAMIHPDDYNEFASSVHKSAQNLSPWRHECRVKHDDGTVRWLFGDSIPEREADGSVLWYGFITDITARKQAEQEQRKIFTAVEQNPVSVVITDITGAIEYVNPAFTKITGYTSAEAMGQNPRILKSEELAPEFYKALWDTILSGEIWHGDLCNLKKNGELFWERASISPVKDDRGDIISFVAVKEDITGLKEVEEERDELLDRFQKVASRVPGLIYQYRLRSDGSSCMPFASEIIRELYRLSPEDVREDASKLFAVVYPDDYDGVRASILKSAQDLTPWYHEYRLKFDDGTIRWLFGNALPQRENDGATLWHGFIIDITDRKQIEQELQISEERLSIITASAQDGIIMLDEAGDISFWNQAAEKIFGYVRAEVTGCNLHTMLVPLRFIEAHRYAFPHFQQTGQGAAVGKTLELAGLRKDGSEFPLELALSAVQVQGAWHSIGIVRDITERKLVEEKLQLAANVFIYAREGIMITAADGAIIDVNAAFCEITGYLRDEVLGQTPRLLNSGLHEPAFYAEMWRNLIEKSHWFGELWNRRKNGEVYAVMQSISAVRDAQGNTRQYVSLFSDITLLKEHERKLENIAHYDALTNLPNRVLLSDRLHQAMAQARRRRQRLAVAFLDLDGFKTINDNYGHEAGDQLLIALANGMAQTQREGDTLARLGGDEFVAVLLDLDDNETSIPILTRLLAAAAQPVQYGNIALQVSASLGVTFYPQAEEIDADQLLRQADQAMYQAKLEGKNRYRIFDAEQDSSVRGHHESLERIRRALTEREFVLYYQPKVNMRSGKIIGAEALIRWQHPERGLLLPDLFLPVINNHPLAIEVGDWVIDSALTQMTLWHAAGLDIQVSVNVGARQLQQADFVGRLRVHLAAHPEVMPCCFELEVLETSALEDIALVSKVIEACREIGVLFALDDFGTGYSSLTYLKRLHVAQLKIDQSFVRDMFDDTDNLVILETMVSLAKALRRQVIAEGVETVEHSQMLLQVCCDLAQGYFIARPMPAHELLGWSAAWRPDPAWSNLPCVKHENLPLLFASVNHRAWIVAIEAFLKGMHKTSPLLHIHQCRFGQWLDTEGLARFGGQPNFQAIELLHNQVHALAAELCELQAQNRTQEALTGLGELHGLRDALLEQLTLLQQSQR